MYLGEIVGFSVSGYLCEHRIEWIDGLNIGSWPSVFVLFGCLGVIWFPIFVYFVHRLVTVYYTHSPSVSERCIPFQLSQ